MRETDQVTKRALQRLIRHPTISAKVLAAELGVSYRGLMHWLEPEGTIPTLQQVRQLVAVARGIDEPAARALAEDLFGLEVCGWLLAVAPPAVGRPGEMTREVLEAGAAVGLLSSWVVEATADGWVGPEEAARGEALIRAGQRELAEAAAAVKLFQLPQLRLAGVMA